MVKINGTYINADGKTISEYLAESGYDSSKIAIEQNGNIIPKAQYDKTTFADGDVIEVVRFVGGG